MKNFTFVFSFLLLQACATTVLNSDAVVMLTSSEWKLTSLLMNDSVTTNIHDVKKNSTIKIDSDLQFFGSGGCNRFFGQAKIKRTNKIEMEVLGVSQMICNDMSIETTFLNILSRVDSYEVESGSLKLKQGDTVLALFEIHRK